MIFDYYLKKVIRRLQNQKWREVTTIFSHGKILAPYFVEENKYYSYGGKIADDKTPNWVEQCLDFSTVSHFHAYCFFIDYPTEEYTHD